MIQTEDLNVTGVNPLTAPKFIKAEYPITDKASETVFKFRKQIKDVLDEKDSRQLVIVGPCSIHHADIALDYADKLTKLIPEVEDKFLEARKITGGYGSGPDILHSCNISVGKGEIAVIVGPNGAGKSTAMKAIFGMLNVREGSILLDGVDITNLTTQDRVRAGMGFVPQNQNIFTSMTVEENLEMGAFIR